MRVFDLLKILNPDILPEETKVHLATWDGIDNPLDLYLEGTFEEWQRWQTKNNFERKYVLSLIQMTGENRWLFAGVYSKDLLQEGDSLQSKGKSFERKGPRYYDKLNENPKWKELNGRLVASFRRPGRQSYLLAEKWIEEIVVCEILAERLSIGEFPGFKAVHLPYDALRLVVRNSMESWRAALSSVAGVYLISDTLSGKLYVGSACGEGGIWQRWTCYAADGHGGNVVLQKLLNGYGLERAKSFHYSILEIADTHAREEDILRRESHWKDVLLSRTHGLNAN